MSEKRFDLYVSAENNIGKLALLIEDVLDIKFTLRHSSFYGEYYQFKDDDGGNISLKSNYYIEVDDWLEPDYEAYPILLYVDSFIYADIIRGLIEIRQLPFILMRSRTL